MVGKGELGWQAGLEGRAVGAVLVDADFHRALGNQWRLINREANNHVDS